MQIKVCGLTRIEDVQACLDLGVNFLGHIFHPKSPRYIDPDLVREFPKGRSQRVGVFAGQRVEEIQEVAFCASLDLIQLHADYPILSCEKLKNYSLIKVFWPERFQNKEDLKAEMEKFSKVSDYFLLDAGKISGGHGRSISTPWLKELKFPKPWFLAGGLRPENIGDLLSSLSPWGLDLNSGVESSPGVKNRSRLKNILKELELKRK